MILRKIQNHRILNRKKLKSDVLNSVGALAKGREVMFNAFRRGIFHRLENSQEGEEL